MRRAMVTAAVLACVLGLAACNDDDSSAGGGNTGGKNTGNAPAAGDSGKTGTPLAGTDPCSLLKPADVPDLSQDDYMKPTTLNTAGSPTCAAYDYSVEINDRGADAHKMEFEGYGVKPLPDIAGHKAVMTDTSTGAAKSCVVSLDVTADEFVRITVSNSEAPTKNCDTAQKAATVVAGKLPK